MTTSVLQGLPSPDALKGLLAVRGPQLATWVLGVVLASGLIAWGAAAIVTRACPALAPILADIGESG